MIMNAVVKQLEVLFQQLKIYAFLHNIYERYWFCLSFNSEKIIIEYIKKLLLLLKKLFLYH